MKTFQRLIICPDENVIAQFVEGKLKDQSLADFKRHLNCCTSCNETVRLAMEINSVTYHDLKDVSKPGEGKSNGYLLKGAAAAGLTGFLLKEAFSSPFAAENNSESHDRNLFHGDSISENLNFTHMKTPIFQSENHFGEEAKIDVSSDVYQGYQDTCAIRSQQLVLNDFGIPANQEQLINEASQLGWYHQGDGTPMEDVGNLLESHGIAVNRMVDANIYNLASELAQGHKVIIGVDANELWHEGLLQNAKDSVIGETPNHALIVAGIDTTDPQDIQVILKDPGTGDVAKAYPMEQFLDAWHDSKNYMVSTVDPAPLAYNPEMVNFNYSEGHIPQIGSMPYEYFENHVMPLSDNLPIDSGYENHLYHDFMGIVSGEMMGLSPELLNAIGHVPIVNDPFNSIHENYPDHHDNPFDLNHDNHYDDQSYFDHTPGSELI